MGSCFSATGQSGEEVQANKAVEKDLREVRPCAFLLSLRLCGGKPAYLVIMAGLVLIANLLEQTKQKIAHQVKVLLLGSGDSGKSTILKVRTTV